MMNAKGNVMISAPKSVRQAINQEAITSGMINAVVNGVIGWFMFRGKDAVPLTIDTISAHEKTVFSTGVMTAFILSIILGAIAFFNFGKKARSQQLAAPELFRSPLLFLWRQDNFVLFPICLWHRRLSRAVYPKIFGHHSGYPRGCGYSVRDYRRRCRLVY
jgi:hypothetical protein